jgi:hypothetical protein
MAEQIVTGYRRLIEVRLLHHYWLDEGPVVFDLIPDQAKRESRLLQYDVRSFLTSAPTPATELLIKGLGGVFRETALGFVVAAPNDTVVPLDAHFDFTVTIIDTSFHDYTSLTLQPQKTYELYYKPEDKIYRYKENVPFLSNLTGASRVFGAIKALFLSKEYAVANASDPVESIVKSGSALMQLTSDPPNANTQQLNASLSKLPLFLHQGDAPAIVAPAGLVGAPARGVLLSSDIRDDLLALISISALGANDSDYDLIANNGTMKSPNPVFQIRFKNRSTFWSYFDKRTRAAISAEATPLPLTYFGNAGTKQKPSIGPVTAAKNGAQITKLVSKIFV